MAFKPALCIVQCFSKQKRVFSAPITDNLDVTMLIERIPEFRVYSEEESVGAVSGTWMHIEKTSLVKGLLKCLFINAF